MPFEKAHSNAASTDIKNGNFKPGKPGSGRYINFPSGTNEIENNKKRSVKRRLEILQMVTKKNAATNVPEKYIAVSTNPPSLLGFFSF